ncbi:hypothetical protein [Rhodococcus triatomae]
MSATPAPRRAAPHRTSRRSGVRLSAHPVDVRHARAADRMRDARDHAHAALRRYGHGSPEQLAAAAQLSSATADHDAAAMRARFDRAAGDRGALLALANRLDAYARMIAHPAADRFAALARRIAATLRALAAALRTLAAITPRATTDPAADTAALDTGPPPPAALFVSALTIAPCAPNRAALSAA